MPSYIIKPKPDEDFYVLYSTVTDCPTLWGTRQHMKQHLHGDEGADERFDRADQHGTSCLEGYPPGSGRYWYGWQVKTFMIREGFRREDKPENAWCLDVPRDQLKEFCERTGTCQHWIIEPMIGTWDYWDDEEEE